MLSPLKSFLTNLQKNAIGATIFGLSPNITSAAEPVVQSSIMFNMEEKVCNDQLSDPVTIVEILNTEDRNSANTVTELGTSTAGQIILVDVNNLKKDDISGSETEADDSYEIAAIDIAGEEGVRSDGSDSGLGSEPSILLPTVNIRSPISEIVPTRSNLKRRADRELSVASKRPKRNITFNDVTVYYFPRMQGFTCVPSQGGCTLGMGAHHFHIKSFTLAEHAAEQRRVHRQQLQDLHPNGSSSEETDTDEEPSENSGSELDTESNGFLQPVTTRQRRVLLKAAGIRKIDSIEKDECKTIRTSREFCGCNCRGYCDPDTCSCSQNGIKCQVDRPNFPCGCTRDGCGNVVGRVEFNPGRVRTHFIHTIMRLELEKKQNRNEDQSFNNQGSLDWDPSTCLQNIGLQNITHCNYSSVIYNNSSNNISAEVINGNSSSSSNILQQNSAHVIGLNELRAAGNESLDLHYAYRDDYANTMTTTNESEGNPNTVNRVSSLNDQENCMHKLYNHDTNVIDNPAYTEFNGHAEYPNYESSSFSQSQSGNNTLVATCSTLETFNTLESADSMHSKNEENYQNKSAEVTPETSTDSIIIEPPAANSLRIDAIHNLLENNRNATTEAATTTLPLIESTICDDDDSETISCNSTDEIEANSLNIVTTEHSKNPIEIESKLK